MSKLSVEKAGFTDQGKARPNNEDAIWVDPEISLIIVADGMGGHKAGEVASGMAVSTIPANLKQMIKSRQSGEIFHKEFTGETNRLGFCLKMANQMIFEAARRYPQDSGMGTTCTIAHINGDRLSIAHVGDTRCYLIRRGDIEQLTEDHSLASEQVRHGLMTREEAEKTSQNILTRALGIAAEVKIDLDEHPLFPDDILVLCSDGLNKELTDEQVLKTATETPEPKALAKKLIDMANAGGGRDNITVAVARIGKAGFGDTIKGFFKSIFGA